MSNVILLFLLFPSQRRMMTNILYCLPRTSLRCYELIFTTTVSDRLSISFSFDLFPEISFLANLSSVQIVTRFILWIVQQVRRWYKTRFVRCLPLTHITYPLFDIFFLHRMTIFVLICSARVRRVDRMVVSLPMVCVLGFCSYSLRGESSTGCGLKSRWSWGTMSSRPPGNDPFIVQHSLIHPFGLHDVWYSFWISAVSEYKSPHFNWLYEFVPMLGRNLEGWRNPHSCCSSRNCQLSTHSARVQFKNTSMLSNITSDQVLMTKVLRHNFLLLLWWLGAERWVVAMALSVLGYSQIPVHQLHTGFPEQYAWGIWLIHFDFATIEWSK